LPRSRSRRGIPPGWSHFQFFPSCLSLRAASSLSSSILSLSILSQLPHTRGAHGARRRRASHPHLSILSQLPPSRAERESMTRLFCRLSILSQLPPTQASPLRRSRACAFQFFPSCFFGREHHVGVCLGALEAFQFFPSCFLTEGARRYGCELLVAFNSFPVASGTLDSCCARKPRFPTFNSFPVASELQGGVQSGSRGMPFQFFPSCFKWLQEKEREVAPLTFNSFPVASEGFVPGLAYKAFSFP